MKLYSYWRSSAAFRVRIALNIKDIEAEVVPVHLVKNGGEQHSDSFRAVNPQGLVPALEHEGQIITNSLAIIEYLDEVFEAPPLLPEDPLGRARVRGIAQSVACDIHPIQNLRVMKYLSDGLGLDRSEQPKWAAHWIKTGFDALEAQLAEDNRTGAYCHGDNPTLADICLVPQMVNARRFNVAMDDYPTLCRIDANAMALESFEKAAPQNQPDAESD